jgi:hypothetical protein
MEELACLMLAEAVAMSRRRRIHGKRRRRVEIPRVAEEGRAADLDRLVPDVALPGLDAPGLREPPSLIVEGPEGARRRRARDERDGVEVADPHRGMLYVGIAVFVAVLVFAVLSLIESR